MAFTVEDQKQLRAAVARTPEMLEALNAAQRSSWGPVSKRSFVAATGPSGETKESPGSVVRRLDREQHQMTVLNGVQNPLLKVLEITEDDLPDEVPVAPVDQSSRYITSRGRFGPEHLYRWVRASGATKKHSRDSNRARARAWARYRDAVAPAAIAEWNVLVRLWAGAYTPARAATPTRSEPDVVPVALNL